MRKLAATLGALLVALCATQSLQAQTTSKLRGDINGDGQITSVDALAILSYSVGKSLPADYKPLPNGDNNGDGQVTALDALIALSFIVGKDVSQFPINKPLQTTALVEISPSTAVVLVGQDAQLSATPRDSTGAAMDATVTWKSSDETIATVDATGKVTAKAIGIAIITATADGKSSSISVAGDQIVDGSVAAEDRHACAVTTTQAAICWGYNAVGQLGDNSRVDRPTPVTVAGGFKWKAVAVAPNFSCGLTTAGAAYCWGNNSSYGLGDGTADVNRLTPTAVSGGRVYQAISANEARVVAITDAGALYAWGGNGGLLGDGTTTARLVPTAVASPAGVTFKAVSVGQRHTIALATTGAAYAWGANDYNQLGDGATASATVQNKPVAVAGNLTFRAIGAGVTGSFGVATDGKTYWWGQDYGAGNGTRATTPTLVPGNVTFRAVASGAKFLVALSSAGRLYTWNGGPDAPTAMASTQIFRGLSSAGKLTVAAAYDGSVWSWGYNDVGQLGDGSPLDFGRDEPGLVGGTLPTSRVTVTPSGVALMYPGGSSTMTVTLARTAFTGDVDLIFDPLPGITGSFEPARLTGAATTATLTIKASPTAAAGNYPAQIRVRPAGRIDQFAATAVGISGSSIGKGMASAGTNNCGLTVAGRAYCVNAATAWNETPQNLFQPVPGGTTFATISSGSIGVCGLTPEGAAYCWGGNGLNLGTGVTGVTTNPSTNVVIEPAPVLGGLKFRSIDVGDQRICALTADGDAYCWGSIDLANPGVSAPKLVPGGIKFFSINAGGNTAVALTSDGTPYGWDSGATPTPVKLSNTLKFVALESGYQAFGGLTGDGSLYMWGTGILGSDFPGDELTTQTIQEPTKVVIPPLRSISVGILSTAAIDRNGNLWWWGEFTLDGGSLDKCIGSGTNCPIYQRSELPANYGAGFASASTSGGYGVALTTTGQLKTWGANGGQFGNGSTAYSRTPTSLEPGFSLERPSSPIWIEPGKTVTLPIKVTRRGGFNVNGVGYPGDITLALPATLPSGVTATISPSTLSGDVTTATITISASTTATAGSFGLDISAKSPGMADQTAPLSGVVPKPIPTTGLDLVCSPANFTDQTYFGYYCMNANGVLAPGKYDIKPLHTPVGGSDWWVETGSEVCVQWDANNGNTRVRYSGGLSKKPTQVDGRWGILVKRDGTPEIRPGNTWFLYTSAMDPQLQAMNYIPTFTSGNSPVLNYNFQKKTGCPW